MLTKSEFLALLKREEKILTHLAGKLGPKHLKFRFTRPQRTTLELLQYLTINAQASLQYRLTGNWDHWDALEAKAKKETLKTFPAALNRQLKTVTKMLKPISEQTFATRKVQHVSGTGKQPLGEALTMSTLTTCIGYRMQLFLQAKAAGLAKLKSLNLWHGRDA